MAAQAASDVAHAHPDAEAAAFVDRFESAWATSKVDALLDLLTDDVVLIQPRACPRPVASRRRARSSHGFCG